jgi:hypothetical protein
MTLDDAITAALRRPAIGNERLMQELLATITHQPVAHNPPQSVSFNIKHGGRRVGGGRKKES